MINIIKRKNLILLIIIVSIFSIHKTFNIISVMSKYSDMYLIKNSSHFNIYCYTKNNKYLDNNFLNEITISLEKNYNEFTDLFNTNFNNKIEVKIYETSEELKTSIESNYKDFNPIGYGGFGDIRIVLDIESILNKNFIPIINHELIHVITMNKNYKIKDNLWLLEGIATYYSNGITDEEKMLIKSEANSNNLPSINEIVLKESNNILNEFGYSLYASLIDYIDKSYGNVIIAKITDEIGNKSLFDILNCSNEELEQEFINYIKINY